MGTVLWTYHNRALMVFSLVAAPLTLGGFVWAGLAAPRPRLPDVLVALAMGILGAAYFLRISRWRVVADEAGVTAHNFLAARRVLWPEIRQFTLPLGAPWARVELKSGSSLPLSAIQPARITWLLNRQSRAMDAVDELNELLRVRSGSDDQAETQVPVEK